MTTDLPSGTVTFLFTDIEGSTKLAQEHPKEWETAQARHHAILRAAIESNHGFVFQIIGDAFCAAFHTAGDALRAALRSQSDLHKEKWGDTPIKVRMGIHTGIAKMQEGGDYQGYLTLSRVQRVMSVAYGGQILISNAGAELVRGELPEGISLLDMKEHRLKGLLNPEHLWQAVSPSLPKDFPPLRSLNDIPNNLPVQLTSFIGREKEIVELNEALNAHRLVTLTGSGGTGKTRLSLRVAAEVMDAYPDGVWFVELAPVTDPALVPNTLANLLGLRESGETRQAIPDLICGYLHSRKALLIFDNCEHLIEACAALADLLLRSCKEVKILASSREALGVEGEMAWHVPSLSLPDPKHLPEIEQLSQYEAVRLFIDRASLVQTHFAVTKDNAPALAQICFRLDGIPLALELAAARVKMLSVDQISSRLDDRFRLLTGGARTALPRQQTLRSMIDWSYDLLSDSERLLLRRLAVFAGGWTLEIAEQVCSDEEIDEYGILDLLGKLVDKSLVAVVQNQFGARYRILETIRQYAGEKLLESGETKTIRDKHLQFFLRLAEDAEPHLHRADAVGWHDRIEVEHENLRLAFEWTQQADATAESGLRLASALEDFWIIRGYLVEGLERTLAALAHGQVFERTTLYANVLCNAAWIASFQGDFPGARSFGNKSLASFRELGDKLGVSQALHVLGAVAIDSKDYALAENLLEEALQNKRGLTNASMTNLMITMGWAAFGLGDYALARKRLNDGLTLSLIEENRDRMSGALGGLAEVELREGYYDSASKLIEESLVIRKAIGDKWQIGVALGVWAWIAVLQHDWDSAFARLKESIAVRAEIGDKGGLVWCLEKLGQVALGRENAEKAAKIFGAAASIRTMLGSAMDPFDQTEYEHDSALLHRILGEEKFKMAWNQGCTLTLEKAIAFALEENS